MDRSLRASALGLVSAKQALKSKGWTQDYLAGYAGCTRQTISKYLSGKPIDKRIFHAICQELDLDWIQISELESIEKLDRPPNLDELVETIRINIYDSIQKRCGTMRVLDMEQPITIDSIYTSVNILEKISRNQRRSIEELLDGCEIKNFDRFILGRKQERIPALEAVERHEKLLILGKPGAGKTTFLKWLALQCNVGKFSQNRVPLFIILKEFAETEGQPDLLGFIAKQLTECGIENGLMVGAKILQAGRSIVLLDGLDEVKAQDYDRVLKTIRQTAEKFDASQFVITCRIAAKEYIFEQFTEVEVADFDCKQIAEFAHKWLHLKDPIKAAEFPKELKANPGLQELATNPLLLTLLCLVFGELGSFPLNRSELYKEGLDVLLKKWDAKRNIQRDRVYQKLSLKRKEDLLSQIAFYTFEQGKYFFKQKEAERYITQYIRNLPDANTEEDALQLDSEAVLKSIEAQHSLFVERARGIYSFSHLIFHEYFAARKIVTSANANAVLQKNATYATDKRWREVLLLTVEMLEDANLFLLAMKQYIDSILSQDKKLQNFLVWLEQKSCHTKSNYKLVAIRAYYFNLARFLNHSLAFILVRSRSRSHALDLALALDLDVNLARDLDTDLDVDLILDLALVLTCDLARVVDLDLDLNLDRDLFLNIDAIELHRSLQQMKNQLPNLSSKNRKNFYNWWEVNGQAWTRQLRAIAIEYRNIGHDWQFSEAQKKSLQQYYDANKLLLDCLNSDCYVSREVREEIESTLLLPISSIEKYNPN
jgi:predicted NACHT family NTPase